MNIEGTNSEGNAVAVVEAAEGKDIRSDIAAGVVGKGWPLFELRGVSLSLEDIFLELTTDDSSHAQPAA